jgi:hypothetical protein
MRCHTPCHGLFQLSCYLIPVNKFNLVGVGNQFGRNACSQRFNSDCLPQILNRQGIGLSYNRLDCTIGRERILHNCNQRDCKHEEVKYCPHCGKVYCVKCGREWEDKCTQNHYPTYYPYYYPYWSQSVSCDYQDSGAVTNGYSQQDYRVTSTCSHSN